MPVGHQQTQKISCSPVSGVEPWLRGIVRSAHPKHGDILPVLDLITAQSTTHCHTGFLKVLMKESILPQSSSPCAGPRQCLVHEGWCTRARKPTFTIMVHSAMLPLAPRETSWLFVLALSSHQLLFLSRECFPGSTLLRFNGRKGGFAAPRV